MALIKKKEQRGSSIEGEGQKREAVHSTHGQCREAWKTAESCGVTGKRLPQRQRGLTVTNYGLGYYWDRPTVL